MIVDLSDGRALDCALAGGKGSQLAALSAKGFPVPPGVVVTTPAFAAFIEEVELGPELAALFDRELEADSDSVARRAEEIQERIRTARLPQAVSELLERRLAELETQLAGELRWAVRSSAVAEDLEGASFAGQYDSILGVAGFEEVADAVLCCWASFFNVHSMVYRRDRGIQDFRAAVVVQRLVASDAAGVCFTLDPVSGASDRVVVNSNFGLGESVVSGRVTPDTFVVNKTNRKLISRQLATKEMKIVPAPGGTTELEIEESLRRTGSLSDEQAMDVVRLAVEVEKSEGRPVDIEWAVCDGELFLLQSRPITAAGADSSETAVAAASAPPEDWAPELNTPIDPRYPVYSNGNISEVLPGCITPLSWSYIGPTIEHAFRTQGITRGAMEESGPEYQVLGFFFHRPYVCVSYMEAAAVRTPGMSPDTIHEEFIGPPETPTPAVRPADLRPDRWPKLARVAFALLRKVISLEREARDCEQHIRRQQRESGPEHSKSSWTDARLLEEVRFCDEVARVSDVHIWASGFAVLSFDLLRKLTRAWLDDSDGSLAARMATGIGSLPSADPAFGLYELARRVLSSPELAERFESIRDDRRLLELLDTDESMRDFRHALGEFLSCFGHRAVCEAEFRNPCWREDPAQVLALVRNYLQPGLTPPEQMRARQDQVRSEAARQVQALPLLKRAVVRRVLEKARRSMEQREQLKDLIVLRSDRARGIYAEIRERLMARKSLSDPDDIYFLLCGEVAQLLTGAITPEQANETVSRRRRDFEWCQTLRVPKLLDGVARVASVGDLASDQQLKGMGVSPGKVEGRARVILDPRVESHIEPGEILVAPVTDAGWTPLFINAGGLVVDVGGLLSHGSVVAREYGLPAVVGVTGATEEIKTGDRIYLDGSAGLVVKLDDSDSRS